MRNKDELKLGTLLGDTRLLLILFVSLRLMMLLVYQPIISQGVERGAAAGGDFAFYFATAGLTRQGYAPFDGWWSEFPPIHAFLISGIMGLLGANANYGAFAMLYGLLMLVFDTGNLLLIRGIGSRLHGVNTGTSLAWIYAVMFAPMVMIWWTFEPMVAFFLLLSLFALIRGKDARSAVWAGIGGLVKFTPLMVIGAALRFRSTGKAARYIAISAAVFGIVYGALLIRNAEMTLPSLTAQYGKPSYQTVWALIDGNYRTGNFGSVTDRLDPTLLNTGSTGNPAVIPGVVRLAAAGLIGLFVYGRTRRFDELGTVAFVAITLLIFFLQAQGWSPQWVAQILPLILLCFPTRDGVIAAVLLSLVAFAEYPFLWIRTGDTGGVMTGSLVMPFAVLVIARTLILVGLCVGLYRRLRQTPVPAGM